MRISKRKLHRIIREEAVRLAEDDIADELDHLRNNMEDDKEHIDNLEKDIKDDREEEERAHKAEEEKNESRRFAKRRLKRMLRQLVNEEHQGYDAREDESLGAEHGAVSDKDFTGTPAEQEHSRRDDAGFEKRTGSPAPEDSVVHHYHHHDDQGYDAREDESLGAEHGAAATHDQDYKDRRDDAGFEVRHDEGRKPRRRKLSERQLRKIVRRTVRRRR